MPAHLLRLYRMGIEILSEQVVRVRRPDAAWLREVLGGRYSYDELMALVASLRRELAEGRSRQRAAGRAGWCGGGGVGGWSCSGGCWGMRGSIPC
jgi:hypothetical protein